MGVTSSFRTSCSIILEQTAAQLRGRGCGAGRRFARKLPRTMHANSAAIEWPGTGGSEPGVYRWREINEGGLSQIELDALQPKMFTLHRLVLRRTS